MYIWEHPDWPGFRRDAARLALLLADAHLRQGRLLGRMERLGFSLRGEAELLAMTEEALKTSEIEGKSSIPPGCVHPWRAGWGCRKQDWDPKITGPTGSWTCWRMRRAIYLAPVTEDRLFGWQSALFPGGRSGLHAIRTGAWRDDADGPMQVVSGPIGRRRVHFEAPPATRLQAEMQAFLAWFNVPLVIDGILHAAIAH